MAEIKKRNKYDATKDTNPEARIKKLAYYKLYYQRVKLHKAVKGMLSQEDTSEITTA